jgi:TPR repeat protein
MLQIGAFPTEPEAKAASARLRQAHTASLGSAGTEIRCADLGAKGIWYRVLVGPFADRSAANSTCARLKAAGATCFLAPAEAQFASEGRPAFPTEAPPAIENLPPWILAGAPGAELLAAAPEIRTAAPATALPPAEGDFARSLRLAEQGDAEAQLRVAGLFRAGRGVARDEAASLRWYRAAAQNGLAEAQFELAKAYDTAIGGPRDPFEAVRWYRLAARQGFGRAQYNLGSMHGNGEGVPKDYPKAYMWFSISEATLSGAEREAARFAKGQAAQLMTPDELTRALQMAQLCLTSAYQNCD